MTDSRSNLSPDIRTNGERLWDSIMDMGEIGPGVAGGSSRLTLTDEDRAGRDLLVAWCREAGCAITIDDMGNIFARRDGRNGRTGRTGRNNRLPPVVSGSHLDTQPHGGKFDGVYGVLAALEVVRALNDHDIETEAPVEVAVWTNEEGCRFAPAMIASGVFAGAFEKEFAWSREDAEGKTLAAELKRIGYFGEQRCGDHPIGAFFEAHIEQGPILEREGDTIGVVMGGQALRWYDITVSGQDAHAGSTPMPGRRDALVAAAKLVQAAQRIALEHAPHGVGTAAKMTVEPQSRNTIPGSAHFSLDMRHPDAGTLAQMCDAFRACCDEIGSGGGAGTGCHVDVAEIWNCPPVKFDPRCITAVRDAAAKLNYRHRDMVSGAGHDACQLSAVVPTAMIFVPCEGGLSHNEAETAKPRDLEAGCNVLLHAMLEMAGRR